MVLHPTIVRSGLRRVARFGGQFTFSIATAICAGAVTSMVLPYIAAQPSAQDVAKSSARVTMSPAYRAPEGVVVPLSSAFTLDGFGGASTENLFSEYVLHVARGDAGPDMKIAGWATPDGQPAVRVARAEWNPPVKQSAWSQRPHVPASLPPRRPIALAQHSAPVESAPVQVAAFTDVTAQSAPVKSFDGIRNWLPEVSVPNVLPLKEKVVSTLSSVGDTLGGWIPHL
ncbi:MAG: hypothetical protein JWM36_4173 [Hyphomicrobiales bacterium]|nr:hypothetical protein [Hyphomicrobiales bacterium]